MRFAGFLLALAGIFGGIALGQAPTVNSDGTGVMNALSFEGNGRRIMALREVRTSSFTARIFRQRLYMPAYPCQPSWVA